MNSRRATLLLTSAGSGVGRCILDALAGRRDGLVIVGADTDLGAAALNECDERVPLPSTDDPRFTSALSEVCASLDVDLVLPCRDPDVVLVAATAADHGSPVRTTSPPPGLVAMTRDKWATFQWCLARGIPFAESVSTDDPAARDLADKLVHRWGFPLIAKPRTGSGSLGVTAVLDPAALGQALQRPGLILQPFLDPPADELLRLDTGAGLPLFWEIPCVDEPALMGVIGPDGEIGPHLTFTATHRLGRVEDQRIATDPSLDAFARDIIVRFRDEGWRGPLNMQVRPSDLGWQIIEINPRFSGGTAARAHLGLDEVGWILNRWLGREIVPPWPHPPVSRVDRILREHPIR